MAAKYTIFCVLDDESRTPFPIEIESSASVGKLKKEIKQEKPIALQAIDADNLMLYKVDIGGPPQQRKQELKTVIQELDNREELDPVLELTEIYPAPPPKKTLHIIAHLPARAALGVKRKASETPESENPSKRLRADHDAAVKNALSKLAPSGAAQPSSLPAQQKNDPILNGRPDTACGPSIRIYERAFADFYRNMHEEHPESILRSEDYELAGALLVASSAIYSQESERQKAVKGIMERLLVRTIHVHKLEDGTSNDGACVFDVEPGQSALLLLCEFKNDIGKGDCDPSVQASFSYTRWWSQSTASKCRHMSLSPTFLFSVAGPWMSVHGAILLKKDWIIQPLTDLIWTGITPHLELEIQIERVARLFYNLKTGLTQLENKFSMFRGVVEDENPQLPFPFLTSYDISGATTTVKYKERLHFDGARNTTAVFLAEDINSGNQLFIKFTSRYNEKAHRLLAEKNLAPQLFYCSEPISRCFMVVMEYIDGDNMHGRSFSGEDLDRVQEAKNTLHEHNIVFGDLRANNIIKPKDGTGVLLVDFDWCGIDGKSRYPVTVNNHKDCGWHEDVRRGMIMRKAHDDHLFNQLFQCR